MHTDSGRGRHARDESSDAGNGKKGSLLGRYWLHLLVVMVPLSLVLFPGVFIEDVRYEGSVVSDGHSDMGAAAPLLGQPIEAAPAAAAASCGPMAFRSGPVAVWDAPGPKKVGIQAGHWLTQEVPDELQRLRTQTGTSGGGYTEWEVNLDIAQRTAALLSQVGIEVEVLPTTLPPCYQAHVFVSVHADGDLSGVLTGFKVARASASAIPEVDDALVAALNEEYARATGLPRDDAHISRRMLNYYAFNNRRSVYAVAPGVPAAIIETGFLTNPRDRWFLTTQTDRVAVGIANGVLRFLGLEPLPVR